MNMRIGVLTGGGDAAGLNAAIRAVGRTALRQGDSVAGVLNGWAGLLDGGSAIDLTEDSFFGALREGGTLLGSSRTNPLALDDGLSAVERSIEAMGLDALVAIGGDDTLSVAARLAERGVPVVGLPKTVDFDLAVTEYCIGFDSAVAIVAEALDRLHTTAASHHRVMVCEVMGRDTGWLAVMGGLAGGADLIIIPEFSVELAELEAGLADRRASGRFSSIVAVAEGAWPEGLGRPADEGGTDAFGHVALARRGVGERLAASLSATGFDTRATVLGHVQRGGSPVASDRIWPTRLGIRAVNELRAGRSGSCAVVLDGDVAVVPLADMVAEQKRVPKELYELTRWIN
jgi:6-phosphofructokinase 1